MYSVLAIASFLMTVAVYYGSKKLYGKTRALYFTPILLSPIVLVGLLLAFHLPYPTYQAGSGFLAQMLGPATVAFAIPMYKNFPLLKKHAVEIVLSVAFGSVIAISSSILLAFWAHLTPEMVNSMAPRSVTTPIAMGISQTFGGIPTMTAVFVIVTGISGMVIGPSVIRWLHIRTQVAKGVMFGVSSHGAGTSRAFEIGAIEGTVSSLSMIVAAGVSLVLAPFLIPWLLGRI